MEKKNSFAAKILVLGDSRVGKSSILNRYVHNSFNFNIQSTIGIELFTKDVKIDDMNMILNIYDTSGQEKYRQISNSYYKGTLGIILVFDLSDVETFINIRNWLRQIKANSTNDICLLLLGNKCDLKDERQIDNDIITTFVEEINIKYLEVSAKDGFNIQEAFFTIAKDIKQMFAKNQQTPTVYKSGDSNLPDDNLKLRPKSKSSGERGEIKARIMRKYREDAKLSGYDDDCSGSGANAKDIKSGNCSLI